MKKFSFRLEKLMRLKERVERLKLQAHEESRRRVQTQERLLTALEWERQSSNRRQREAMSGRLDVSQLRGYSRYYHKLRADRLTGEGLRQTLVKDQHAKHRELVAAARERKSLERFKEKARSRFIAEIERAERIELDELSAQRYILEKNQ